MNRIVPPAPARIAVCSSNSQARALWLVFSQMPAEERNAQLTSTMDGLRLGQVTLDGLWEATRDEQLVGALWSYVMPGRQAMVWPPQLIAGEPETTGAELLQHAIDALARRDVLMAQAILPPDALTGFQRLASGQFQPLAELMFLVAPRDVFPAAGPAPPPDGPLTFEPVDEHDRESLVRIVEQTYLQTLDCPRLNGLRRTEDVLTGYQGDGAVQQRHWHFVVDRGERVGCLLLSEHLEWKHWELVYMGLVPSARGRGGGRQIARHALWLAAASDCTQMILAVDALNQPAIAMYMAVGFAAWGKRSVWFRMFDDVA